MIELVLIQYQGKPPVRSADSISIENCVCLLIESELTCDGYGSIVVEAVSMDEFELDCSLSLYPAKSGSISSFLRAEHSIGELRLSRVLALNHNSCQSDMYAVSSDVRRSADLHLGSCK